MPLPQGTRQELADNDAARVPDNPLNAITPADMRAVLAFYRASMWNKADDGSPTGPGSPDPAATPLFQRVTLTQAQGLLPSATGTGPRNVKPGQLYLVSGFAGGLVVAVEGLDTGYFASTGYALDPNGYVAQPVTVDVRGGAIGQPDAPAQPIYAFGNIGGQPTDNVALTAYIASQGGLLELVLPMSVTAGRLYVTATGIWAARRTFTAQAAPATGVWWRIVGAFGAVTTVPGTPPPTLVTAQQVVALLQAGTGISLGLNSAGKILITNTGNPGGTPGAGTAGSIKGLYAPITTAGPQAITQGYDETGALVSLTGATSFLGVGITDPDGQLFSLNHYGDTPDYSYTTGTLQLNDHAQLVVGNLVEFYAFFPGSGSGTPGNGVAAQNSLSPASATVPPTVNAVNGGLATKIGYADLFIQAALADAQTDLIPNQKLHPPASYLLRGAWNGGLPGQAVVVAATTAGDFSNVGNIKASGKPVAVVVDVLAGTYFEPFGATPRDLLAFTGAQMDTVMALAYTNCDADPAASPAFSFPGQQFDAIDPADGGNYHYYCTRGTYVRGTTTSGTGPAWHRVPKI